MASVARYNAGAVQEAAASEAKFARAHDFFHATPLVAPVSALVVPGAPAPGRAPTAPTPAGNDPSIATDQGSVQFHLIGQKPDDPKYSDIMQENADNLLAMGGLIYSYMKRSYPSVNLQTMDIGTWVNVVKNLPDLAIGQQVEKTYTNRLVGASVSGDFLSMIAKAIITDGASLLTDFTSYLNSIGSVVFSASNTKESYNVVTCTYQNYLVADQMGGYYDYSAIVLRQINFLEYFTQLKSSCASAEYVNINMKYSEVTTLVQSRRIRQGGPDYKLFQGLVNADATAQFANANNFFNGGSTPQSQIKPNV